MTNNLTNAILLSSLCGCSLSSSLMTKEKKQKNDERPNIVFYLTEDLSPQYLALYNQGKGANTPNVAELAKHGIIYTNAYSNAPVSSAARTTEITGCYAPKFAGSFHRHLVEKPMPDNLRMFPTYLRQNGYYTYNVVKTDYNVVLDKDAWDNIKGNIYDWEKRPDKSKPFFLQRSNMVTHESRLQFSEETYRTVKTRNNPDNVYLHPYLPDTKLMRYTYATFYDRIEDSDKELGEIVERLKKDNLLDNTFIFYMGDNGGTLPGTKGYTNDIGLHVPLVVYVPDKWKDKIDQVLGSTQNGLVSFMDLGPTALNLAGVKTPKEMDGSPFLGKNSHKGNKEVHCYGDRYDELYSFNRVIRKGDFRYARNYQPYHPQGLYATYRYKQLAFQEWRDLYEQGKLNELQSSFFEPIGAEELYDLKNDPLEKNNLVNDPKYRKVVLNMRKDMNNYMHKKNDLGFFPETIIIEDGIKNPTNFGIENSNRIKEMIEIADLELEDYNSAKANIAKALNSKDDVLKWWGLTVCSSFGKDASEFKPLAYKMLNDKRSYIRSRAFVFLSILGEKINQNNVYTILKNSKTEAESMLVLNDYTYMVDAKLIPAFKINNEDVPQSDLGIDWRIKYLNDKISAKI